MMCLKVLSRGLLNSPSTLVLYMILHLAMVSVRTCTLMTPKFILSLILGLFLPQLPNQDEKPVLWLLVNGCVRTNCSLMREWQNLSWQEGEVAIESVQVGGCDTKPTSSAHNLGATFDKYMTLKPLISSLVKSCPIKKTALHVSYKGCCREVDSCFYHLSSSMRSK